MKFTIRNLMCATMLVGLSYGTALWTVRPYDTQRLLWTRDHDLDAGRLKESLDRAELSLPVMVWLGDELVPVNSARVNRGGRGPEDDMFELQVSYE